MSGPFGADDPEASTAAEVHEDAELVLPDDEVPAVLETQPPRPSSDPTPDVTASDVTVPLPELHC